ncbi:MAG: TVP38/TMEM64 family protein [Cyanobacteria bacterium J06632_22]
MTAKSKLKKPVVLLLLFCLAATAAVMWGMGGIDPDQLETTLARAGIWAPIVYIVAYTMATLLMMPSTPLNLIGGALFGAWMGTLWTSVGAMIAALVAFAFTRTVGRNLVQRRLGGNLQNLDQEIRDGGLLYMFSIRLLPLLPYGLVNFAAGLTSIRLRDYALGTAMGTVPGVLPYVMLGSSGLKTLETGEVLPLVGALTLIALLVGGSVWYRRQHANKASAKKF